MDSITMKTNIELTAAQRRAVAGILAKALADEHVLYLKTRNYHWNVTGPRFHDLHLFFEQLYGGMEETIDEIAERIRALGEPAPGNFAKYLKLARLKEETRDSVPADEMLANLLADHEAAARQLREDIETVEEKHEDVGTADFLTGLLQNHEKTAWMLRSTAGR